MGALFKMLLNFLFRAVRVAAVQQQGGDPLELETINGSAHQVGIDVGQTPRQSWWGFGFGLNAHGAAASAFTNFSNPAIVQALCEDLNTTVIRVFTPENSQDCLDNYLQYWNLMSQHGIDTVFASCFKYTANPDTSAANLAAGIDATITGGLPIDAVSIQNEPDGNPNNAITGGTSSYVTDLGDVRTELDNLGRQSVDLLSYEWRHCSDNGPTEFDLLNTALMAGDEVHELCLHLYDKCPDDNLYDNRWATVSDGVWSTETGNNASPNCQARFVAGLNHGTKVELIHIGYLNDGTPDSEQLGQVLLEQDGTPRPWYAACRAISTSLPRGTVFRLCLSDDNPPDADGASMPANTAQRMIRDKSAGGLNPRHQVAAGVQPGGNWVVVAVNATEGTEDDASQFLGGHYASLLQQFTVTIPELVGVDGTYSAKRATDTGLESTETVNMVGGVLRFTLPPGDTLALVQD